jgi:hypothetical protein
MTPQSSGRPQSLAQSGNTSESSVTVLHTAGRLPLSTRIKLPDETNLCRPANERHYSAHFVHANSLGMQSYQLI